MGVPWLLDLASTLGRSSLINWQTHNKYLNARLPLCVILQKTIFSRAAFRDCFIKDCRNLFFLIICVEDVDATSNANIYCQSPIGPGEKNGINKMN